MADHPHTIDRGDDATGENLIEQIAAVSDYLLALETYRATVKIGQKTRSRCATERGSLRRAGGSLGDKADARWRILRIGWFTRKYSDYDDSQSHKRL